MTGDRYRLVTEHSGGERHVSAGVLGEDEISATLEAEALLHELGGWEVTRSEGSVLCRSGSTLRVIAARRFDPMNDNPTKESGRNGSSID